MRYLLYLLVLVLALAAPVSMIAQTEKPAPEAPPPDTRPADMFAELSKFTYTAKRNIPATDSIFVENKKVLESSFSAALAEHGVCIKAKQSTTVSKVVLLDRAVQVFLENEKCGLLILTREDKPVAGMELPALLELTRDGLGVLFTPKPVAKEVTDSGD